MSWLVAAWERLPAKVRVALAGIAALLAAGFALFFGGKRRGRLDAEADATVEAGKVQAKEVRDLAAAGDDAGVQNRLAEAAARAARTTGRQ
jgi:hypothetical protein